jgi:hypothetical protein
MVRTKATWQTREQVSKEAEGNKCLILRHLDNWFLLSYRGFIVFAG